MGLGVVCFVVCKMLAVADVERHATGGCWWCALLRAQIATRNLLVTFVFMLFPPVSCSHCKLLPLSSLHSPSCPKLIRAGPQEGSSGLCDYAHSQWWFRCALLAVSSSRRPCFVVRARSCCVAICQDREWLLVTNAILFGFLPASHPVSSTLSSPHLNCIQCRSDILCQVEGQLERTSFKPPRPLTTKQSFVSLHPQPTSIHLRTKRQAPAILNTASRRSRPSLLTSRKRAWSSFAAVMDQRLAWSSARRRGGVDHSSTDIRVMTGHWTTTKYSHD